MFFLGGIFDGDGRAYAIWDTGGIVPLWSFPGMVEKVLDRDISEVEEDFEAAFLKDRFKRGKSDGQG